MIHLYSIHRYFQQLTSARRILLLFIFFLIANVIIASLIYTGKTPPKGLLTNYLRGDGRTYVELSENLKQHGVYGRSKADSTPTPSDFRMPGFAFYYFPLTCMFGKIAAVNAVIILQTVFSAFAKALAVEILYGFSVHILIYFLGVFLLALSSPITEFNSVLITESMASSYVVVILYLLLQLRQPEKRRLWRVLLAGFIFTCLIFLRPFFLPFYAVVFLYLFMLYAAEETFMDFIKVGIVFLLPFVVIESGWIARNYIQFNRFMPLESSIMGTFCKKPNCKARQFIQHWGGSFTEWDANTEGTWFQKEAFFANSKIKRPSDEIFPSYLFTNGLTIDTLRVVQHAINDEDNPAISKDSILRAQQNAVRIMEKFDNALKSNNPFIYYVYSRWASWADSFLSPGVRLLPINGLFTRLLLYLSALDYLLLLSLGGIVTWLSPVIFIFKRNIEIEYVLLIGFPLLMSIIMNLIILDHEARSVLTIYYPTALLSLLTLNFIWMKAIKKNNVLSQLLLFLKN